MHRVPQRARVVLGGRTRSRAAAAARSDVLHRRIERAGMWVMKTGTLSRLSTSAPMYSLTAAMFHMLLRACRRLGAAGQQG